MCYTTKEPSCDDYNQFAKARVVTNPAMATGTVAATLSPSGRLASLVLIVWLLAQI